MKGRAKAVKSFLQGLHVLHGENNNFLFFTSLLIAPLFTYLPIYLFTLKFDNRSPCNMALNVSLKHLGQLLKVNFLGDNFVYMPRL